MARENPNWFEFNGRRSTQLGVLMRDVHSFSRGAARGVQEEIAGRDGFAWLSDGATEAFDIRLTCRAPKSRLREISAWLNGSGGLRFSNEPELSYDARVIREIEYRRALGGADPLYEFSVTFTCQPFPRAYPAPAPVTITSSGEALVNPGTAPASPRITIQGSGSFSLTIGKQSMFFSGVEQGVVVDSELMDALTLDGSQLANDKIEGDFFTIAPGTSYVQWIEGGTDATGSVSQVTIEPRWRYL